MKLIDDAWKEFRRLWTIRILIVAGLFNGVCACLFIFEKWVSPITFISLNIFFNVAAIVARMIAQKKMEPHCEVVDHHSV